MASSETTIRQWDVVVFPFHHSDKLSEKRRPALVVSSDKFNKETDLLWVAMITSTPNIGWHGDIEIPVAGVSGLTSPSIIRNAKLATIERDHVVRVIGRIDVRVANKVKRFMVETVSRRAKLNIPKAKSAKSKS
jgi:mRNA interferase MazF